MPFTGTLTYNLKANRAITGNLSFEGSLDSSTGNYVSIDGILSFAGGLGSRIMAIRLSGSLSFTGDLIADKVGGFLKQVLLKVVNLKQVLLEKINFSE